jgi:transcriptional regulator with XRE-family HTH domain
MNKKLLICLGRRVRALRMKRGLSQEELAESSGLHRNYVGAIERGEKNPTITTIKKLTKALKVSLTDFFDGIN